ncbi:MAG: CHAD domain-containing protein [Acidimicrobiaceae bacterium]|nr:CHAD domain-containing protein [Acidimicrobiaceae bacterium]
MNNFADQFALSSGVGILEIAAAIELASKRTTLYESLGEAKLELWDTADWRFHARNLRIEVRRSLGAEVVIAPSGGYGQIGTLLDPAPRDHEHPENIDPAGMALRVKTITGDRALIKLAELKTSIVRIWLVDEFEKRLGLFEIRSCTETNLSWIIPRARTGYLLEFSSITDSLRQVFEPWMSMPEDFDMWRFSLLAIGRKPFDYTPSFSVRLEPDTPASKGIGSLLLYLHSSATKNLDGMVKDLDPEFTHDFRVSIRRARSIIAASSSLLDNAMAKQLRSSLGQLANLAGQVRDLDVSIESIATIPELNNDSTKMALQQLREEARNELLRLSNQGYITEILGQWHRFATEAFLSQIPKEASISQAARSQLLEARSSMLKVSNKKRIESDHESLHDLRKKAKALRYLLEGYSSLLDPRRASTAVSDLKGLQDYLGKLQDRATLLALLRRLNIETIDPELFEIPAGVGKALASFKSKEADRHYKELLDAMIKRSHQ